MTWQQGLGLIAAAVAAIGAIDSMTVSEDELAQVSSRLDAHIEHSNENVRIRNENWRKLGLD